MPTEDELKGRIHHLRAAARDLLEADLAWAPDDHLEAHIQEHVWPGCHFCDLCRRILAARAALRKELGDMSTNE